MKGKLWRVRIRRAVDQWVELDANTPEEAEALAGQIPNVLSVFGKSATPGNRIYSQSDPAITVDETYQQGELPV